MKTNEAKSIVRGIARDAAFRIGRAREIRRGYGENRTAQDEDKDGIKLAAPCAQGAEAAASKVYAPNPTPLPALRIAPGADDSRSGTPYGIRPVLCLQRVRPSRA